MKPTFEDRFIEIEAAAKNGTMPISTALALLALAALDEGFHKGWDAAKKNSDKM